MSETILNWLITQMEFPNKINNIEEEFANGYYFGKILHSNQLYDNIKELKNTNKKEDSLKNYSLIKKALDKIDIHLTESDINELLNKKRYKAELYLYKIKQKLSLKNCQFNEIMEKMKKESIENKKVDFNFILKSKRNQSAKPSYNSNKFNINDNNNNYYNKTNYNIESHTKNYGSKNSNKLNFTNYTQRLKSAKLPNLKEKSNNKIDKRTKNLFNDNNKDDDQELQDERQIQSVLNDIKIFENIHMKKNLKKYGNKKNPWDKINYIYDKDFLSNNNKQNEDRKKMTILDLVDLENKKDNNINVNDINNKIAKLKSTLHNHNQFKVDNKKNYINKKAFEQGLSHMGINSNAMLPALVKIKDKNIPSEVVMKSINDAIKEKKMILEKEKLLNNLNKNESPKPKKLYIPSSSPTRKITKNLKNKDQSLKRPFSSTYTYKSKNKKNIENNIKENKNLKRPLTAKESKAILKPKETNINFINNALLNNKINTDKNQKKSKNYKKYLSKIIEDDFKVEEEEEQISEFHKKKQDFHEDEFFKKLNKQKKEDTMEKFQMKKTENLLNKKNMKEIVSVIIDMMEVYYDYQQEKGEELVNIKKWHEVEEKFIKNKPIIKRKKKKKILTEEEIGNYNFDIYSPINEEFAKNYDKYEISEMKNYINQIGDKYDRNINNLFMKKMNIKEDNIEINDVMGDEIQILFDKAKAEGKDYREEEDEEEFKRTGKIRYHPSKEEEELLEPCTFDINEYSFTNLISDIIKFGYNKDLKENLPSHDKFKKTISGVIEEPRIENSCESKNNEDENINLNLNENNEEKKDDEINNNNNEIINNENENEEKTLFKDLLNSIPVKISFIGLLNNEIKITIKNSINKFPKMKIYNPIEFLNDLRQKKKKIDEPIDEQNLRKFQVDQLKKEKNNLTEEIKDYIELIENKDNLSDDEMCIKILQKKIKEDFETKNIENVKQEIISKRDNVNNINNELNKIKEEQQKKQKTNLRELQVYQQQLDKIEFESMIGFVIINFPNTYGQSKLMEEKMINFIQPCEQNKSHFDQVNDKLLFLCDQEQKDHIFIKFGSFLEKIVYFYCDNSKLIPENPQIAQPQPHSGINQNEQIEQFTKNQIDEYKNNFKKLEDFYQNFNLQIDKYDYYDGIVEDANNQNNANNNLNMNSNNFMIRDKIIIDKLRDALNIYEEKIVPKVNNSVIMNDSAEESLDETKIKEKDSSRKVSGDSSLKQPVSNTSKPQIKQQQPMKDSDNSSYKNNDILKVSPSNNDKMTTSQKQILHIKQKVVSISQISEDEKIKFYKMWYNFNIQYIYYLYRLFFRERTLKRKKPEDELKAFQKKFINFLTNPTEQIILINQFIQKYKTFKDNYCKSNKIKNSSNITIIKNIQKDLAELNETLWNIAKIRKNQAFQEIEKLEKENYIEKELNLIYFKTERLIIFETQKLIIIINILIRYLTLNLNPKILSSHPQITQFSLDILVSNEILKNVNEEEFAKQKDKKIIYPRANRLYKNCFRVLIKIYIFLENYNAFMVSKDKKNLNFSVYKSMKLKKNKIKSSTNNSMSCISSLNANSKFDLQNQIKTVIKMHINKYKYKMYNLYLNTLENLSKIYCPFQQVIKLMDNWIVLFMDFQNKKIKEILKTLDLTNNYKRTQKIEEQKQYEQIEKNIVDSIIKDDNSIYNFQYIGINENDFPLFNKNKFLGIEDLNVRKNETDKDCLLLYNLFKEFDILRKLRNNEIQKGIMVKSKFEDIFFKFFLFDNISKFPKCYQNIDYHKIHTFLSHFTILSSEFRSTNINNELNKEEPQELVYTNDIITILLLSCICFDIYKEYKNIENCYINKDKFLEMEFEFEKEVNKIDGKSDELKIYLFDIHKNNNETPEINVKQFINLLSLKMIKNKPKKNIQKYFELFDN